MGITNKSSDTSLLSIAIIISDKKTSAIEIKSWRLVLRILIAELTKTVKVIKSGQIKRAVKLSGVGATAGAKAAIEAAGGSVA